MDKSFEERDSYRHHLRIFTLRTPQTPLFARSIGQKTILKKKYMDEIDQVQMVFRKFNYSSTSKEKKTIQATAESRCVSVAELTSFTTADEISSVRDINIKKIYFSKNIHVIPSENSLIIQSKDFLELTSVPL